MENAKKVVIECIEHCVGSDPYCGICQYGVHVACKSFLLRDVLELLKEQETKTGHWIEKTDYNGDIYYDCSVCNESWMTIEGTPWVNGMNYCPHCGAKMEER